VYDTLNLRAGVRWRMRDTAAFVNDVTDEEAARVRPGARDARASATDHQARMFGVSARIDF
jgi:hypothetical protein